MQPWYEHYLPTFTVRMVGPVPTLLLSELAGVVGIPAQEDVIRRFYLNHRASAVYALKHGGLPHLWGLANTDGAFEYLTMQAIRICLGQRTDILVPFRWAEAVLYLTDLEVHRLSLEALDDNDTTQVVATIDTLVYPSARGQLCFAVVAVDDVGHRMPLMES